MAKEGNHTFWKDWLADLADHEKKSPENANWNHGRKEKNADRVGFGSVLTGHARSLQNR
jgi:hypothetical protein